MLKGAIALISLLMLPIATTIPTMIGATAAVTRVAATIPIPIHHAMKGAIALTRLLVLPVATTIPTMIGAIAAVTRVAATIPIPLHAVVFLQLGLLLLRAPLTNLIPSILALHSHWLPSTMLIPTLTFWTMTVPFWKIVSQSV
jgi:hypothetical protein